MKRSASAVWFGELRTGDGMMMSHSSALDRLPFTYSTRFEDSPGTNPEELLAGAHATCFTMAVCAALTRAGFPPTRLSTQSVVSFEQIEGTWTITHSHLDMQATVPGVDAARFAQITADARDNCPVTRVLRATVSLEARLEERD